MSNKNICSHLFLIWDFLNKKFEIEIFKNEYRINVCVFV